MRKDATRRHTEQGRQVRDIKREEKEEKRPLPLSRKDRSRASRKRGVVVCARHGSMGEAGGTSGLCLALSR